MLHLTALLSENDVWHARAGGLPLTREVKFAGEEGQLSAAAAVLRSMTVADGEYPRGAIESVYFDSPGLDAYRAKENGDLFKRKIRIRWYDVPGRPAAPTAFLEIKDRVGAARDKFRRAFPADPDFLRKAPLTDPGWMRILEREGAAAGVALPRDWAPVLTVRYDRERFLCPLTRSRISLDYHIECTRANPERLPSGGSWRTRAIVCEAKSATVRHWPWNEALYQLGMRASSFSKFGLLMEHFLEG